MPGPFDLNDAIAYAHWREQKLDTAPRRIEDIIVEVDDPRTLAPEERRCLIANNARCNMAIYVGKTGCDPDKAIPRRLGEQLGLLTLDDHWLTDQDGISPISVTATQDRGERRDFIPYTDKPIRWHTDGYYNPPERSIRALSDPEAMTIPPRMDEAGIARAAQPGPVFSVDADGSLHMRYTARTVSIARKDSAQSARQALEDLLARPSPWILRGRLEPGMGLVCNNVLHDRSGFTETPERRRLLYRARYYERVTRAAPRSSDS